MAVQERQAARRFLRSRLTVTRWTPINDVGDVGALAVQSYRAQHAIQQLAGATDEGQTLPVLVRAGGFADEHYTGCGIAIRKDEIGGVLLQFATVKIRQHR